MAGDNSRSSVACEKCESAESVVKVETERYLELDCPPLGPRPDSLLERVLRGTVLPMREASTRSFGCWTFDYSDLSQEYDDSRKILQENIQAIYAEGLIRYGAW